MSQIVDPSGFSNRFYYSATTSTTPGVRICRFIGTCVTQNPNRILQMNLAAVDDISFADG